MVDLASREHDTLAGPLLTITFTPAGSSCPKPPALPGAPPAPPGPSRPGIGGGGGGPSGNGGGSVISTAPTDLGDDTMYSDDYDEDGIEDDFDNCMFAWNPTQDDTDADGDGDICDTCRAVYNPQQLDLDGDLVGDECDADADADGIPNDSDGCVLLADPRQADTDGDGQGDACDDDDDNDGFLDLYDHCPLVPTVKNLLAREIEGIRPEDCDADLDQDGIFDSSDNCPGVSNGDQADADADGLGDLCDGDRDGDTVPNSLDLCPKQPDRDQRDGDRDGLGDACDPRFCYVVDLADPTRCLRPDGPFALSAGADQRVQTGEPVRLRIFANREGVALRYAWSIRSAPPGSTAVPDRARGAVERSVHFEYAYPSGAVASFTPDQPGRYELGLRAELAFPVAGDRSSAAAPLALIVEGDPVLGQGCVTVPTSGLNALLLRRR